MRSLDNKKITESDVCGSHVSRNDNESTTHSLRIENDISLIEHAFDSAHNFSSKTARNSIMKMETIENLDSLNNSKFD